MRGGCSRGTGCSNSLSKAARSWSGSPFHLNRTSTDIAPSFLGCSDVYASYPLSTTGMLPSKKVYRIHREPIHPSTQKVDSATFALRGFAEAQSIRAWNVPASEG